MGSTLALEDLYPPLLDGGRPHYIRPHHALGMRPPLLET